MDHPNTADHITHPDTPDETAQAHAADVIDAPEAVVRSLPPPAANALADDALDEAALQARKEIFDQSVTFKDLGIRNTMLRGIEAAGFKHPTGIQSRLIPAILSGRDVIGQAKTGTGKTAAFGVPLYNMYKRAVEFQSLILAPTRELAIQIAAELSELGQYTPIKVAPIYGGQRIGAQADKLRRNPEVLVGTPGRVMDLLERGLIHFRNIRFVVLDEVDRMLDIGFREDIKKILSKTPQNKQTIFVSATLSPEIEKLARSFMHEPEKIVATTGSLTVSLVKQYHLPVQPWDKRRLLRHLLTHEEPALTVVFCRLKRVCDELAESLTRHGFDAHAIHADLSQSKRNQVMEKLRTGKLSVLIASDLASRGIDVDDITHVINYDLPDDVELYVHRIGRTARAGRGGTAWSFVTPDQGYLLTQIEMLINAEIPKLEYPDFTPGEPPEHVRREREAKERRMSGSGKPSRFSGPDLPAAQQAPAARGADAPAADASGDAAPAPRAPAPRVEVTVDAAKFPGGLVPTKLPEKRMMGRVRGNRR